MIFVIALMLLFNLFILVIAAAIVLQFDASFDGFWDAFANGSLKWMLTPNAILEITQTNTLVVAVTVLIIGMILFSGTIIALTTNLIKDYFQARRSGSGRIYLSNHIVVLNWNNKVPELVADLMHIEDVDVTIAILADVDKQLAEKQIINAINKTEDHKQLIQNLNVLVKTGDPLINSDLEDISITEAISVIIMNKESNEELVNGLNKSDLNIIKTILNVGRMNLLHNPSIVAEIKRIETKQKIITMSRVVKSLEGLRIMPICFDRRLGQIISQTIIHNAMEDVYLSLFSFAGSEVYYLPRTSFEDALYYHTDCVPLAHKKDGVFVLSKDDKTMYKKSNHKASFKTLKTKLYSEATSMEVYILGRNNKLDFILDSFSEYEKLYATEFTATWVQDEDIEDLVEELNKQDNEVTIVLLSEELEDLEGLDANVIDQLIYLEGHLKRDNINIIVELLDPKNDTIIKDFDINNTIISNKIVSLLLSKLALFPDTESFYENLLTLEINEEEEDDQEVFIRTAEELLNEPFPMSFESKKEFINSLYHSFDKRLIPFAYFHQDELVVLSDKLHETQECIIHKDDAIVLMKL
jgi:hypothetical protein